MKEVASINRIITIGLVGFNIDISMIRSFEKNPAINGNPQSAIFADSRAAVVIGI